MVKALGGNIIVGFLHKTELRIGIFMRRNVKKKLNDVLVVFLQNE